MMFIMIWFMILDLRLIIGAALRQAQGDSNWDTNATALPGIVFFVFGDKGVVVFFVFLEEVQYLVAIGISGFF